MDAKLLIGITLLLIFSLPMLIFSVILLRGKGASLIAGFNTMSKAKQATWDTKAMCRFMGVILLIFTLLVGASFWAHLSPCGFYGAPWRRPRLS